MDAIINNLNDMEAYTRLGQNAGTDTGAFHVMHARFGFEVDEQTSKRRRECNAEACPRLVLRLSPKSWLRNNAYPQMVYQDQRSELLESQVGRIIYDMFVVANKLQVMDELMERKEQRREAVRERQRRLEAMRAGELQELKSLEQAASDWDKARKIRSFADFMEEKIAGLNDPEKQEKLRAWLKWAREKADWLTRTL